MVHLIVHLVRKIKLCGPVYLSWMYPVEQYMKILKGYTKNLHHPKASIFERYIVEETIEFCTNYIEKAKAFGLPESWHDKRAKSKGLTRVACYNFHSRGIATSSFVYIE